MKRGLLILLCWLWSVPVTAQTQLDVQVAAVERPGADQIVVDLLVTDTQTGVDIGIQPQEISVLENGRPAEIKVELLQTTAAAPTLEIGSRQLQAQGATIGLVVDLSTAINVRGDAVDYLAQQRELALVWLEQGRDTPSEQIGLFLPPSYDQQEAMQLPGLEGFVHDRNLLIQALQSTAPRRGATQLHETIRAAIKATTVQAQATGTNGYVVVLSDGGDPALAAEYITWAAEVPVLVFAVGSPEHIAFYAPPLERLAATTGGEYVAQADPAAIATRYSQHIQVRHRRAYRLVITPQTMLEQQQHTLQVMVATQGMHGQSAVLHIPPFSLQSPPLRPLMPVLGMYFLQALLGAVVLAASLTLLLSRWHNNWQAPGSQTRF